MRSSRGAVLLFLVYLGIFRSPLTEERLLPSSVSTKIPFNFIVNVQSRRRLTTHSRCRALQRDSSGQYLSKVSGMPIRQVFSGPEMSVEISSHAKVPASTCSSMFSPPEQATNGSADPSEAGAVGATPSAVEAPLPPAGLCVLQPPADAPPKVLFVIGPTGVGKTRLGMELCLALEERGVSAEIISADSMQVRQSVRKSS